MTDSISRSNDLHITRGVEPTEPDAHGQAALLLAEATLHALVETGMLSTDQAIAVVRSTCEIKVQTAEARHESAKRLGHSLDLLARIEQSFAADRDRP